MYEQKTTWLMHYTATKLGRTKQHGSLIEAETHQKARKALLASAPAGVVYRVLKTECVLKVAPQAH